MYFSATKCNIMCVTHHRNHKECKMMGTTLESTKHCQYHGINIQDSLKWKIQSQHVASKASRIHGFIYRKYWHASTNIKRKTVPYPSKTTSGIWYSWMGLIFWKRFNIEQLVLLQTTTPIMPVSLKCYKPYNGAAYEDAFTKFTMINWTSPRLTSHQRWTGQEEDSINSFNSATPIWTHSQTHFFQGL